MILSAGKSSEKPVVLGRRKCQRQQDRRRGLLCTDTTFWRGLVAVAFVGFAGVTGGEASGQPGEQAPEDERVTQTACRQWGARSLRKELRGKEFHHRAKLETEP